MSADDVQTKRTITPSFFLSDICPFVVISMKTMSALRLKNHHSYFHETGYKNKPLSDNMQRIRTVTPPIIFAESCPFEIYLMKINLVRSVTLILSRIVHETWYKYKAASDEMQRIRSITPATIFCRITPL